MIHIAINGFGRIGRSITRIALNLKEPFRIVAINDICDWEILSYLLERDSTHGHLGVEVNRDKDKLIFKHNDIPPIHICNNKDSQILDFAAFGADIVIESSGQFLDTNALLHHCKKGVKKVILAAPPIDDMPTFAMGVNDSAYKNEAIFSNASCTANAIAPICKVIDRHFGIDMMSFCITHSYTNEQSLLDSVYPNDKRRSRAAAQNIIPTHTGATNALVRLLPHLKDKIAGHSVRVPVSNVILCDMTFILRSTLTQKMLVNVLIEAANSDMKGIIGIDNRYGVSSDFIGDAHSVIVAPDLCYVLKGNMARILTWSDNEYGYANRVLDIARMCYER